tara:strand:- start:5124 stop:5231 length:108 start_codon:yes stop_codon:yes gene_type:complete
MSQPFNINFISTAQKATNMVFFLAKNRQFNDKLLG